MKNSMVKVVLTAEKKEKVIAFYNKQKSIIDFFDEGKYLIEKSFLFFKYKYYDWGQAKADHKENKYVFCWLNMDDSIDLLWSHNGKSLIRLNNLLKSGNELYLSSFDSKVLNDVLNGE